MGGTVNMGGKVLYTVIHLYNSCTQYSQYSICLYTVILHMFVHGDTQYSMCLYTVILPLKVERIYHICPT